MKRSFNVAIVGLGYWGPNILRAFLNASDCRVKYCCDIKSDNLLEIQKKYPHITTTTSFDEIISDPDLNAVVLAVPTHLHFKLAQKALVAGKDVLLEKPMTSRAEEAWRLVKLAQKHNRILMVDNVLLFNPAVAKIKELIDKGGIGDVLYIDSSRTNLGLFRKDVNVIYDLASHEFSVIQFLLSSLPKIVSVTGTKHVNNLIDVAYLTAEYPRNILAHVHVSWLSPLKIRRMLVVGTKKMVVFDDNEAIEKIKIYDRGIIHRRNFKRGVEIGYRFGDIWSPHLETGEPLNILAQSFINTLRTRTIEKSGPTFSAEIVEILETSTKLFKKH